MWIHPSSTAYSVANPGGLLSSDKPLGNPHHCTKPPTVMLKAKIHYASLFRADSELAPNRFGASSEPASVMEFGTNQLQTSSEQAPKQLAEWNLAFS